MRKIFIILSLLFSLTLTSANTVEVTQEAKITGLYVAFFNRAADQSGLEYWTTTADNVSKEGGDVSSVFKTLSKGFATHPTFTSTYAHLNNEEFVKAIYRNALGRDGDAEGIKYWTDLLDRGMIRSDMVATFVELSMVTDLTPANYPSLSAAELAAAQLRQDLITNKVTVALEFTHQLDTLSNVVDSDNPESDPAYLASIKIISEVNENTTTVVSVQTFLESILYSNDQIGDINSLNQTDPTSTDPIDNADVTPPIITIVGDNPMTTIQGDAYIEFGAMHSDDESGINEDKIIYINNVDTTVIGEYRITYGAIDYAGNSATATRIVNVVTAPPPPGEIVHNGIAYNTITSPYTGRVWLDRNLGASRVCTAYNDSACYGDYYQWGRNTDGHQKSTSAVTNIQATDVNNVGNAFIRGITSSWTSADSNGSIRSANWSNTDGASICPVGFRVPTADEFERELLVDNSADIQNRDDAFNSFLKLPASGLRQYYSGNIYSQGSGGYVWTSTGSGPSYGTSLDWSAFDKKIWYMGDGAGLSVRCLKHPSE